MINKSSHFQPTAFPCPRRQITVTDRHTTNTKSTIKYKRIIATSVKQRHIGAEKGRKTRNQPTKQRQEHQTDQPHCIHTGFPLATHPSSISTPAFQMNRSSLALLRFSSSACSRKTFGRLTDVYRVPVTQPAASKH